MFCTQITKFSDFRADMHWQKVAWLRNGIPGRRKFGLKSCARLQWKNSWSCAAIPAGVAELSREKSSGVESIPPPFAWLGLAPQDTYMNWVWWKSVHRFLRWYDVRTDGQPKNIMPPVTATGGIKTWNFLQNEMIHYWLKKTDWMLLLTSAEWDVLHAVSLTAVARSSLLPSPSHSSGQYIGHTLRTCSPVAHCNKKHMNNLIKMKWYFWAVSNEKKWCNE